MTELTAAPISVHSDEDLAFFRFWYEHMRHDQMHPPLENIAHATARYIWDAAMATRQNDAQNIPENIPAKPAPRRGDST